jgi:selenocysteine-specific elongation factor
MLTIGTSGHIDHGKSSLVKALTTIDPDRLPEEKERGMTLDLGFAWLNLPSGEAVGVVDVPGHKQFVHNVIPGLFGIDAVLLVVAADDGWMPQTEEHLQILNLLGISHGILVLNKVDLVADPEWLDLVESDIARHLENSSLAGAPIMRVSARTGQGIEELKQAIGRLAGELAPRKDIGKPRLPIDRVFTIKGSGVVVTGTLSQGIFTAGDDVVISPQGLPAHIRTVESYKHILGQASPGSRVALNLAGLKREEVSRGNIVLAAKYNMPLSRLLDVELKLLPGLDAPLKNMAEVLVYLETRELLGRVILPAAKPLKPGETVLAQLRFTEDLATFIGERFVIRQQSPAKTIGGGLVLDPQAARFKLTDIDKRQSFLSRRQTLKLEDLILSEVEKYHFLEVPNLLLSSLFLQTEVTAMIKTLIKEKKLIETKPYLVDIAFWQAANQKLLEMLAAEHAGDQLSKGLPQATAQGSLGLPREAFDSLVAGLASTGKLVRQEDVLALPDNKPRLSAQQETMRAAIIKLFEKNAQTPPTVKEITAQLPDSYGVVRYLSQQGELVEMAEGILMTSRQFKAVQDEVIRILKEKGQITIQDINARLGFSRKYSIPLLTQMDRLGLTRRDGDLRVPGKKLAG